MTKDEFYHELLDKGAVRFSGSEPHEVRAIPAQWIREADGQVHNIFITGATIVEPLRLDTLTLKSVIHLDNCTISEVTARYSTFSQWFRLDRCTIEKRVILYGASFHRGLWVRGTTIAQEFNLNNVTVSADLDLDKMKCGQFTAAGLTVENSALLMNCQIAGPCRISFGRIGGQLDLLRSQFGGITDIFDTQVGGLACVGAAFAGEARLQRVRSASIATFTNSIFHEIFTFVGSQIQEQFICDGAKFLGEAHLECRVGSDFFAREAIFESLLSTTGSEFNSMDLMNSTFKGEARLLDMKVNHSLSFSGCTFAGDVHLDRSLVGATMNSMPTTKNQTRVGGTLTLGGAKIVGQLNIAVAQIDGIFSLEGVSVGADVSIEQCHFLNECKLNGMHIGGNFDLHGSKFEDTCNIKSSEVRGDVVLNSCQFEKELLITQSELSHDMDLQGASMGGLAIDGSRVGGRLIAIRMRVSGVWSSRGARIDDVILDQADANLATSTFDLSRARLDFRGFHYELLEMPWRPLAAALTSGAEFDRQPLLELEAYYRRAGRQNIADDIYLLGRTEASRRLPRFSARRLFDFVQFVIAGYGVRPEWSLWWAVGLLVCALAIFLVPGSARPSTVPAGTWLCLGSPGFQDKLALAITSFIPGTHEAGGWSISECPIGPFGIKGYVALGILQLLGGIVFPLALAAVTGLLHYLGERPART